MQASRDARALPDGGGAPPSASAPLAGASPGSAALAREAKPRSPAIDVMRGVCATLVVLHHIHLRFRFNRFDVREMVPRPLGTVLFDTGHYSVVGFLVISGFLITTHSLRRWQSPDRLDWALFLRLRFARIAPCLLLLVALLSVLHWVEVPGFVIERVTWGRAVFAALTFHVNWLEGTFGYLPGAWDVLWSLSVEEVFYLAFPAVCLLCRTPRALLVPLLALIVAGPFNRAALHGQVPWAEYAYLSCMDGVAIGCITAFVAQRLRLGRAGARALWGGGLALLLPIVVFRPLAARLGLHEAGLDVTLLELGVAALLLASTQHASRSNPDGDRGLALRGTGWLRMVGRSSYELYMTHMLVLLAPMPLIVAWRPATQLLPGLYVALLALSVALGWVVHRFYSEPLNRALRPRRYRARE